MTRRPGERDDEFVKRAGSHPLALPVKRADLEDNLRQAEEAGESRKKYESGLEILVEMKNEHGACSIAKAYVP